MPICPPPPDRRRMSGGQTEGSRLRLTFGLMLKLSFILEGLDIDVEAEVGVHAEFDFT